MIHIVHIPLTHSHTHTLNAALVCNDIVCLLQTPEATKEDPKTLQEHIEEMTSYTPEPGVRFKEFSMWWDAQPYELRVAIFKRNKKAEEGATGATRAGAEPATSEMDNPMDAAYTQKELANHEFSDMVERGAQAFDAEAEAKRNG